MTSNNSIAILIPVYNPGSKLRDTLDSIAHLDLSFTDIVVVIVNDGGDGEDIDECISISSLNINLISLIRNGGITAALNAGLEYIESNRFKYVARIDAGDIAINNRIRKQFDYLEENPNVAMVGSQVEVINLQGNTEHFIINSPSERILKSQMFLKNVFFHCSVMYKVSILGEIGKYNSKYLVAQDYDFFFRICESYKVGIIDEILTKDLYNPNGISYSRRQEQLVAKLRIQVDHFDFMQVTAYLGIVKSIIILSIPTALVLKFKQYFFTSRGIK